MCHSSVQQFDCDNDQSNHSSEDIFIKLPSSMAVSKFQTNDNTHEVSLSQPAADADSNCDQSHLCDSQTQADLLKECFRTLDACDKKTSKNKAGELSFEQLDNLFETNYTKAEDKLKNEDNEEKQD
jgi:hypothetical protein